MTSNSDLYGFRKQKLTSDESPSINSLAFTSKLSDLLASSNSGASTSAGRPRPSKKDDIFTIHNKNTKKRAARDADDDEVSERQTRTKQQQPSDLALHRSKRKLEAKSRIYTAMKRGDLVERGADSEALVDFDRKWADSQEAEKGPGDSSDGELDCDDGELIDYEDEYGRARRGTRAEAERVERHRTNRALGAEELDRMSARPAMPRQLIYGDTVQTGAFQPDEPVAAQMEELASKRDRSLTPPDMKHYEADKEIRTKGVGFYSFSKDEKLRGMEFEALEKERIETERMRREREDRKSKRKREIEERKITIAKRKAMKQADTFLEGLAMDVQKPI